MMSGMASTVTYYRPVLQVPGVYIIQVTLELLPTQSAIVNVGRERDRGYSCGGYCGRREPIERLLVESQKIEKYEEFRDIWAKDTVTIEIRDNRLGDGPYQISQYTATMDDIQVEPLPCALHGRKW